MNIYDHRGSEFKAVHILNLDATGGVWFMHIDLYYYINPLKPRDSICATYFRILKLCILPTGSYGFHSKQRFLP